MTVSIKDAYATTPLKVEEMLTSTGNVLLSVLTEDTVITIHLSPVNALVLAQALSIMGTKGLIQAKDSK